MPAELVGHDDGADFVMIEGVIRWLCLPQLSGLGDRIAMSLIWSCARAPFKYV